MNDIKTAQRNYGKTARKNLEIDTRKEFSRAICDQIKSLSIFENAFNIMTYSAFGSEVDLYELNICGNKKFYYPVCLDNYSMLAACPNDENSWIIGDYNIKTPMLEKSEICDPDALDLILVPCTAFDKNCNRMGMGKGYYDRFLKQCTNAIKIGIAFECQRVDEVITDCFDIPLDLYVTEQYIYFNPNLFRKN